MKRIITASFCLLLLSNCIEVSESKTFSKLPPGKWRAILKLTNPSVVPTAANITEGQNKIKDYFELPFNLEFEYEDDEMVGYLINGKEKIKIENLHFGRDLGTAKDTLIMDFTAFDTYIDAFYEENFIEGYWVVPYKDNYQIPFLATYGLNHRFIDRPQEDTYNFDGEWLVEFEYDNPEEKYPAIATFNQDGHLLDGTFKTETGDYRFLSGNAYGDKMRLSVFDGAHAFLFSGSVSRDTIYGEFRSGSHYKSNWIATRKKDNKPYLKDPYQMTQATNKVQFNFPNASGEFISLGDENYSDKYKLINIMGTWCPNCRDEINFLKELKHDIPDIEIVSIAFERYRDEEKSMNAIRKYKSSMDFDWPILLGGYANKKENSEILEFVDKIYSYPTLLLVDKNNQVVDIHTGFYGPATEEYQSFKSEYLEKIQSLYKS